MLNIPLIFILFAILLVLSVILFYLKKKKKSRIENDGTLFIERIKNIKLLDDPISEFLKVTALNNELGKLISKHKLSLLLRPDVNMSFLLGERLEKFPFFKVFEKKSTTKNFLHLALEIEQQPKVEYDRTICPDHDLLVELYDIFCTMAWNRFLFLNQYRKMTLDSYKLLLRKYDCNFRIVSGNRPFGDLMRTVLDEVPGWGLN